MTSLPDGFVELPAAIYRDDPMWIPEEAIERSFSSNHPWFASGREAQAFAVPGRARVAGFSDPALVLEGERAAFFGCFESTGDPTAERAVFDEVRAWAKARGARRLYGPVQFSTARSYRVRLSIEPGGVPIVGEPHNPARYASALEALGFAVHKRYETKLIDPEDVPLTAERSRPFEARVAARGYRIEPLDAETWMKHLRAFHVLVEEAFAPSFGYVPMRFEEFEASLGAPLARKIEPHESLVAWAPDGSIAGFVHVYPHWGPLAVQAAGAARVRVGDLDFREHAPRLAAMGRVDWVFKTVAVSPRVPLRAAIAQALTGRCARRAREKGVRVYAALIREDNTSRRLAAAESGARWFALYRSEL